MLISLRVFFATISLLSSLKKSDSLCRKKGIRVTCKSVRYISSAVISRIPNISEVEEIQIESSPDLEVFSKAFHPAVKLKTLRINNNKNIKFYNDSFQNVSLTTISLIGNNIKSIPEGTFSNLPLEVVSLNNNNLSEVPVGFANSSLCRLYLSNNKIQSIDSKVLEHLPRLRNLELRSNKLESIHPHRILSYPQRLIFLDLTNNYLPAITNYMLQRLKRLFMLRLAYNYISFIEVNSFEHTPNLAVLILSHNNLKHIHQNIFPSSGSVLNLVEIYLDNNRLMHLSSDLFVRLKNLDRISIAGNPWLCSCLIALEILLREFNISVVEKCNEDYASGKRPICVSDKTSDSKCIYVYNTNLSKKYIIRQNKSSVKPSQPCNPFTFS